MASVTPPRPAGSRDGQDAVENGARRSRALHLSWGGAGAAPESEKKRVQGAYSDGRLRHRE